MRIILFLLAIIYFARSIYQWQVAKKSIHSVEQASVRQSSDVSEIISILFLLAFVFFK